MILALAGKMIADVPKDLIVVYLLCLGFMIAHCTLGGTQRVAQLGSVLNTSHV